MNQFSNSPNPFGDNPPASIPPLATPYTPVARPRNSGKAIAAFVFGLLTFCLGLFALPAAILGVWALVEISGGRRRGLGFAIAGLVLGFFGFAFNLALILPAVQAAREAARRTQSSNNLIQIGLAIHNHHDVYTMLPPAGSLDRSVTPQPRSIASHGLGLSWRVRILPFLEQQPLYDQFKLDEAWDSPHNQALIPQMPKVFRSPNRAENDFKTVYLGVATSGDRGQGKWDRTVFHHGARPVTFADIIDGTSSTIMVVEADADQAVIWTKPEDWKFDPQSPRRGLGHLRPGGFLALFVDASRQFIPNSTDDETLRKLFARDDGEIVRLR